MLGASGGDSCAGGLGLVSSCEVSAVVKSSFGTSSLLIRLADKVETAIWAVLDIRLLNAGHPLHPSAPPVPLQ